MGRRMFRRGRRPPRRRRAREHALDVHEPTRQPVRLRARDARDELGDARAQQTGGRVEHLPAARRELESEPAAVVLGRSALDQAVSLEAGDELGDGRARDAGPLRELDRGQRPRRDRPQGEELRDRQRRVVRGEQALDPARRERRGGDERVGDVRLRALVVALDK